MTGYAGKHTHFWERESNRGAASVTQASRQPAALQLLGLKTPLHLENLLRTPKSFCLLD